MFYAIYYMLTPRCLLSCGYCFRDTSKESLEKELSLEDKKKALKSMIENLNVRKISLSGGEPTFIGGLKLVQFYKLIDYLRDFKRNYPDLRIELLSNAILLEEDVLDHMVGVVDRITITLDTIDKNVLEQIGRNTNQYKNYLQRFEKRMIDMNQRGFETKLHTVITPVNYDSLEELARYIKAHNHRFNINRWKFYQYMTYDDPVKDAIYEIDDESYEAICGKLKLILSDIGIDVTFKDNNLMIESMLNLTHYGTMEHVIQSDGEKIVHNSRPIWEYENMESLARDINISIEKLSYYHAYNLK